VIELPEPGRPKQVSKQAEAVRARETDVAAARAALIEANKAIESAIFADREAYADAVDAGGADPGRELEVAARAEADEAKRRLSGEELRLQRAEGQLREAIEASLPAWTTALERATAEAEAQALDLVDQLRAAEGERARRRVALFWVTCFKRRAQLPGLGFAPSADTTLLRNRASSDRDFLGVFEMLDHIRAGIEKASLAAEAARLAEPQRGRPILHVQPAPGPVVSESDAA
jgi:hypothetical protein